MKMIVLVSFLVGAAAIAQSRGAFAEEAVFTSPYYRLAGGKKVDAETFSGWRMYHETCVMCHGADGVGTERAPDLTRSVRRYTPTEFTARVLARYVIAVPAGETGTESGGGLRELILEEVRQEQEAGGPGTEMPKWGQNPIVRDRILAIYGYLMARSDGVLKPGHPEILK